MITTIISLLGLILDIIGAWMLYEYGLPSRLNNHPPQNEQERAEYEKADRENEKSMSPRIIELNRITKKRAKIGISLITAGFFLQFFAQIISAICH